MDCSTDFPDRVELARQAAEALGYGLVIRVVRSGDAVTWTARLSSRNGSDGAVDAGGITAADAAEAALARLRPDL